ncbi:MAG: bifunctional 5,10-methylenetetrahydrofolate dehydrogenase/5,10-methenyltetrahydrofolate cyclohydrolase [Bacilli bacterium]
MILDGKKLRDTLLSFYKEKIELEKINITLAIIRVGNDKPSKVYIKNKVKYCSLVGINVQTFELEENTTEEKIINLINKLNNDNSITGIILQSPVPKHINFTKCVSNILPCKDIDGFTKDNLFNLIHNKNGLFPCTSKGIIKLLKYYNIDLNGKNVCIIGRGDIVGKPLIFELLNNNATVSICHSYTKNIKKYTKSADIIISAVGKPNLITYDMVKKSSIIVDVGISVVDGKIIGDVDFENVSKVCKYITPNPGGVGPMTIAMIIENLIDAYYMQKEE